MKRFFISFFILSLVFVAGSGNAAIDAKQEQQTEPYNAEYNGDMLLQNWGLYNIEPSTNYLWVINYEKPNENGGVTAPLAEFVSETEGSFLVYIRNNYNEDMTGKTITADLSWEIMPESLVAEATVPDEQTFKTRSTVHPGAYVRLEFQDVIGNYNANNYWWSTDGLDLNAVTEDVLSVSLKDRSKWSNLCGQRADDDVTIRTGTDCVGGEYPGVTAYDGFTNAVKNVKQVGVSFGNTNSYASGVAVEDGTGEFTINNYTIHDPVIFGDTLYVDNGVECDDETGLPYCTIQAAVDDAGDGDTIIVAEGTYDEQILIDGKDITLIGEEGAMIKPDKCTSTNKGVVEVYNSVASIQGFSIDGNWDGKFGCMLGIYAKGGCNNVDYGDVKLTARSNVVANYGKNGITANCELATAVIEGSSVTGRGPLSNGDYAQNGIQLGWGASGTIVGNTITDHYWDGCSQPGTGANDCTAWVATGVLLYLVDGSNEQNARIKADNTFENNQHDIMRVLNPDPYQGGQY